MEGETSEVDLFSTKSTCVVATSKRGFAFNTSAESSDFLAGRTLDVGAFLLEIVEHSFELLVSVSVSNIHSKIIL